MSEYNWREHWESYSNAGEQILTVSKMETGELVSVSVRKLVCIHGADGVAIPSFLSPGMWNLTPKKKLRPWTAKEWGIRIGDEFVLNDNRVKLIAVARTTLCFEGASEHFPLHGPQYAARQDDKEITQLDGSPCGEYE